MTVTKEEDEWGKRCETAFKIAVLEWASRTPGASRMSDEEYKAALVRLAFQVVRDNPPPARPKH